MPMSVAPSPTYLGLRRMTRAESPTNTTAVIGAGPYGLSVAAHLQGRGVPAKVFGEPMESWQKMPARMALKSVWSASSLADPNGAFSLERYCRTTGAFATEPIPLPFFLDYARWFQEQVGQNVDRVYVRCLRLRGGGFQLALSDGREFAAARVVVAVGVRQFAFMPQFARGLPRQLVSHSGDHVDFRQCRSGRRRPERARVRRDPLRRRGARGGDRPRACPLDQPCALPPRRADEPASVPADRCRTPWSQLAVRLAEAHATPTGRDADKHRGACGAAGGRAVAAT